MGIRIPALAAAGLACLVTSQASATQYVYNLFNHPDGGARDPLYGLRLDELFDVSGGHDVWTMNFEMNGAGMQLVYDDGGTAGNGLTGDDSVRIFGTAYGGLDTGSSYGDASRRGMWEIDFTYDANNATAGNGGDDIKVNPDSPQNNGWIKPLFDVGGDASTNGAQIAMTDEAGSNPYSFKFNNYDDHRLAGHGISGPDVFVGWGWVNHGGESHVYASDWLFTGEAAVPEPATMSMVLLGMAGVAASRRRKKK